MYNYHLHYRHYLPTGPCTLNGAQIGIDKGKRRGGLICVAITTCTYPVRPPPSTFPPLRFVVVLVTSTSRKLCLVSF